jgi:mRNA interferase MazF
MTRGTRRSPTGSPMRRGDVYLVDLNPPRGSEADKIRPAVIVSTDAANRAAGQSRRGVITVVPVTSNVATVYRFQVRIPAGEAGLKVASKAQAEQVRAVDVTRLTTRIGSLPPARLAKLDAALRLHLDL